MNRQLSNLANEMFHQALWWSYSRQAGHEELIVSDALQTQLGREVKSLDDLMGMFKTEQLILKIEELLLCDDATNKSLDNRVVASYETVDGKRSYQHQLKKLSEQGRELVWASCVDVTEMVEFEREMVDAQGRITITQMTERQKFLEEQNKFISDSFDKQSRFLALLSHELRSPLLGITGLVKRLKNELDTTPEVLNMLKTIGMTAEQSTYLVNDILTYSQTEYDGITLHPSKISLSELFENVKQLTQSIASDKNLNISLVHFCQHDEVYADGVRLTQILINLIVNGIKFTQYGGVYVEVKESEAGEYHFKISDSGEGIPENRLQCIFEPFAQLESEAAEMSTKKRYLGAGLGLFVVRQLVMLMGGEIKVSSTEMVGTTFEFSLPLSLTLSEQPEEIEHKPKEAAIKSVEKYATESPAENADSELQNKLDETEIEKAAFKVLVADDSKINCMVLSGYLSDLHCEVVEAKDGRQAWNYFQNDRFDYVLLDIQMPFMDGIEVSQEIQKQFEAGDAPWLKGVFAITAGGESSGFIETEEMHESVGFDEWLVKPVTKEQIIKLLHKNYRSTPDLFSAGDVYIEPATEKDSSEDLNLSQSVTINDIPEQFHHLVQPFINEMFSGLEQMLAFNEEGNLEEIKKLAHYLKGNCMLFQLSELVSLCKELENLQENKQIDDGDSAYRKQKTTETIGKIELSVKSLEKSSVISHNSTE